MIDTAKFVQSLRSAGVDLFVGVPDSLMKDLSACIQAEVQAPAHVITPNEGSALAMAVGHYIGTGSPALVYLQNSGLGNIINPLTSLADREVYSIPVLLMIGWRGEPGVKDEPQHVKQGRITPAMLDSLEVPYEIIDSETDPEALVARVVRRAREEQRPVAMLVRKGAFSAYKGDEVPARYELRREEAIKTVAALADPADIVVATTGHTSRELYEHRVNSHAEAPADFLTVGGMGHTSAIALALSLARPERQVICLDGDGSLLMHMGMCAIIGSQAPKNFIHVLLNNGAHDSVGGQPTVGFDVDFREIARACGYRSAHLAVTLDEIESALATIRTGDGPALLEIRVRKGARPDLGRPKSSPLENRDELMKVLQVTPSR